jgi:hypothetical protein
MLAFITYFPWLIHSFMGGKTPTFPITGLLPVKSLQVLERRTLGQYDQNWGREST